MFLFYAHNDLLVDGSIDVSWTASNNIKHEPVRQSLYTDWNPITIATSCERWAKSIINQSSHYNSILIVGNSDTIYNIIDMFHKLAPLHISIIKGTNNNV